MDVKPIQTPPRPPIVRGARACTVCRAAKMKCVGAEDGIEKCQRCKRTGSECVFEKHKRGRKPGSKLSEASKMLRRLEKGLNNAKLKSQMNKDSPLDPAASHSPYNNRNHPPHLRGFDQSGSGGDPAEAYPATHPGASPSSTSVPLGPGASAGTSGMGGLNGRPRQISISSSASNSMEEDADPLDPSRPLNDAGIFPAKLIRSEKKHSFFRTILNPENSDSPSYRGGAGSSPACYTPASNGGSGSGSAGPHPSPAHAHSQGQDYHAASNHASPSGSATPAAFSILPTTLCDPIDAGILTEEEAHTLFDLIFLRLNPFINLFDPILHTVDYVRGRCPFLFTTLIMAACKFFRPESYQQCLKLANEFALKAFSEVWKRVEVVQAFACLTYWRDMNLRDPNENRTWTYIGYACRMAVELNLNRYVAQPSASETSQQRLERRNRERTYLVLFVHDRSLSTQTGKPWMLQECELVRHSPKWHEHNGAIPSGEEGGAPIRPEDVILASFVHLRRIVAETTEVLVAGNANPSNNIEGDRDARLRKCNAELNYWVEDWKKELGKAGGEHFHWSFINLFHVYVRLFINSFGIRSSLSPSSRVRPNLEPLYSCFRYAMDVLRIVSEDLSKIGMLTYSQDSISVMSAYATVFLLRLIRSSTTLSELEAGSTETVYERIRTAAEAYHQASLMSTECASISYHSRFLSWLIQDEPHFTSSSSSATPTATTGGSSTRRSSSAIGGPVQVQAPQPIALQPGGSIGGYYPHQPHHLSEAQDEAMDHPPPYPTLTPSQNSHLHPSAHQSPQVPVQYIPDGHLSGHATQTITPLPRSGPAPLHPSHPHVPHPVPLHPHHSPSPHGPHPHHSPHPLVDTHPPHLVPSHTSPTQGHHPQGVMYYAPTNPHQMPHHHRSQRTEQDNMYWNNILTQVGDAQSHMDPLVMGPADQFGQYQPGMRP